jgi:hypothetical protein
MIALLLGLACERAQVRIMPMYEQCKNAEGDNAQDDEETPGMVVNYGRVL